MAVVASGQVPALIVAAAQKYGVPPSLALEVGVQESGLNPAAVSPAGAIGVMQLMPGTAAGLGVDPNDTAQNIDGGVRYLAQLLSQFGGNQATALAAYNWGSGNVSRAIATGNPDWLSSAPAETQNYVASILSSVGTNYTATVTPASIASGAADVASGAAPPPSTADLVDVLSNLFNTSPAGSADDGEDPAADGAGASQSSLLLLTAAAIGAFLLLEFVAE